MREDEWNEGDAFEALLAEELREQGQVTARAGLEARVMAAVFGEVGSASRGKGWLWRGWAVGIAAAGVVAMAVHLGIGTLGSVNKAPSDRSKVGRTGERLQKTIERSSEDAAWRGGSQAQPSRAVGVEIATGRTQPDRGKPPRTHLEERSGERRTDFGDEKETGSLPKMEVFPAPAAVSEGEALLAENRNLVHGFASKKIGEAKEDLRTPAAIVVEPVRVAAIRIPTVFPPDVDVAQEKARNGER